MKTGLALVAREQRLRLVTVRWYLDEALGHPDAVTDPDATRLCAALSLVQQAIEILNDQQQTGSGAPAPVDAPFPAGDE